MHPAPHAADRAQGRARSFVGLVGNPVPGSRTSTVTDLVLTALQCGPTLSDGRPDELIELADHRRDVFGDPDGLPSAQRQVADASVLVVGTPSYQGSFTGVLKLFLDSLPAGALAGTVAVPVVLAGSPAHAAMTDVHLRWVLGELGACLPVPSVVLTESRLDGVLGFVDAWKVAHQRGVLALVDALAREGETLATR